MLYKDFSIERPKNTKIIGKNTPNQYIYFVTGKVYNKKTKFADDKKRICIGKMIDDTHFMPNDNYFEIFGNECGYTLSDNPNRSDTLKIGAFLLIQKLMKDMKLEDVLEAVYGTETYRMIVDIVSFMLVSESSSYQYFPDFMYNHNGLNTDIRQDTYISRFLKTELNDENTKLFLAGWNNINKESQKMVYINYDSTNMNTHSKGIELAEYGHAKVDEGLPQVNVSYVVKQEDCRPLFYEVYPGSIIDNTEFEYMIQKAKEYGYENIGVVLDRGYYSKKNVEYLREYGFLMMVKGNNPEIRKCIDKNMIKLKNLGGYLKEHLLASVTEEIKLFATDKEKTYVHIYYDDVRASEERKVCELGIIKMEEDLEHLVKKKIVTKDRTTRYEKMFKLRFDEYGYLEGYQRNEKEINNVKTHLGFFSLISNVEKKASEAIEIYRNRDQVEKMFMMIKSGMEMDKFGVQSDEGLQGKLELAFIASIIRSEINERMKKLRQTNRKEYTVPSVIKALENIEVTRNTKGGYIRRYALTSKQKKILKEFGIDDKYINEKIEIINKQYKMNLPQ